MTPQQSQLFSIFCSFLCTLCSISILQALSYTQSALNPFVVVNKFASFTVHTKTKIQS
jgi:hypothetical protein